MSDAENSFAYEFGEWLVEPELNRICREGQEIQLEPRTSEVLRYLLEHPGEIVSIDELLDTVWAGRIVESASPMGAPSARRKSTKGLRASAPRISMYGHMPCSSFWSS